MEIDGVVRRFPLCVRRHRRASNKFGAALERRMLLLLGGAALVALLMAGAGNPRNWRWLAPDFGQGGNPQHGPDAPQHFVVATAEESSEQTPPGAAKVSSSKMRGAAYFPGVRSDYLREVRDDTVFRAAESDSWFQLFAVLQRTPNDELVAASEGPATCLQLSEQPAEYRGRLVTVSGIARAAKQVAAPENAVGIDQYYQLWLQPDLRSDELIVLYCLELPESFPLGSDIEAPCTATGFFFKRWAYESQGGIATAPLVIAKTLAWQPPAAPAPTPRQPLGEQLLTATIAALVLAALMVVFVVWRGRGTIRMRAEGRMRSVGQDTDASAEQGVGAALAAIEQRQADDDGPREHPPAR